MGLQAALLTSAALTAEVNTFKQSLERSENELGRAKKQKGGRPAWQPAFSYEQTLDAAFKFHSGANRPTTRHGSAIGSHESPKARGWCRLHLLARRLQPLSSRLFAQQSEPFKMSSQTSTPPTSSSQAKLETGAVGADNTKKSTRSPPTTQSLCIGPRGLSAGAGPITQR